MLDLLLSIIILIYFTITTQKIDNCYYAALTYNILHILCHMLILIPLVIKIVKQKSIHKIKRQYIKSIVISHYRMPIFCWAMIGLSLINLYSIIVQLFYWNNYSYLFIVFCLICSSLTQVSNFIKLKLDCSLFFSLQTYKFFCLAVSSILFGISAHQVKLSAEILGMGWAYFVYRSKQSLPKQIIYYLILFMDVVILLTAIMVISTSQQYTNNNIQGNSNKGKYTLLSAVTFFGFLFSMQIYQFVQLYKNFGNSPRYRGNSIKQQSSMVQFYSKFEKLKKNSFDAFKQLDINHDCSICLQNFKDQNNNKGEQIILQCNHYYHSQCLEQWAAFNTTCPMCRRNMLSGLQQQISV